MTCKLSLFWSPEPRRTRPKAGCRMHLHGNIWFLSPSRITTRYTVLFLSFSVSYWWKEVLIQVAARWSSHSWDVVEKCDSAKRSNLKDLIKWSSPRTEGRSSGITEESKTIKTRFFPVPQHSYSPRHFPTMLSAIKHNTYAIWALLFVALPLSDGTFRVEKINFTQSLCTLSL